jgi:hypothetical protein
VHTVAALVLRPPGLAQLGLAPDEARMKEVGDEIGRRAGYDSQFSWQLYDTAGTTEDDTYAATGGYGYTIEMGPKDGPFHGDYQTSVIDQWTGEYAPAKANGGGGLSSALTYAAEIAAERKDHAVLKGTAPAGNVLRLERAFETTTSEYCTVGIEPVVDPGLPIQQACPEGVQEPITLSDELNSTTTVPAGGAYQWHVGQSTRPFVGGGATLFTYEDEELATLSDGPGTPGSSEYDLPFTVAQGTNAVEIDLTSTAPSDSWGLDLQRKNADGTLTSIERHNYVDSVGEQITFTAPPVGEYVVTAYNAAALTPFTLTVTGKKGIPSTTTGTTEPYTLTCEAPDGKVLESHAVTIGRGQQVVAHLACGGEGRTTISAAGPQDDVVPTRPAPGDTATPTPAATTTTDPGATPAPGTPAGTPAGATTAFRASAAVDRTSLALARRSGLRVRLRGTSRYDAVIRLRDGANRTLKRTTLKGLTGRRTVRVRSSRMRSVASVRIDITDVATGRVTRVVARGKIRRR